jgi:hypothetical protein
MNVVLYLICLVLLLPVAALAAYGFLIDSLVQFGLWEVFKMLFAPIYDPFGKGIWIFLFSLGLLGLGGAGFFPASRPYGFGAIAAIGILSSVYIVKVYPNDWAFESFVLFIPSLVGVALSIYCVVRPVR